MSWQWVAIIGIIVLGLVALVFITNLFAAMKDEEIEETN